VLRSEAREGVEDSSKRFCEEDIDQILTNRTTTIVHDAAAKAVSQSIESY
jgi:hypothetical protein